MAESAWRTAKEALAVRLATIAITDPVTQSIAKVFPDPPASIEPGLLPCIVFGESSMDDEWGSSVARERYVLTCTLMLRDEDSERASDLVESYRDALKEKLRHNLALLVPATPTSPHAGIFEGPSFTAPGDVLYGTARYLGFQFTVSVIVTEPVTFADTDI